MGDSGRYRRALVAVVVAVQVGVPGLVLLTQEQRPARFGWHMFAATSPEVTATITDEDGTRDLPLGAFVARLRPEVDWSRELPPHLCEVVPDARAVTVRRGEQEVRLTCRP